MNKISLFLLLVIQSLCGTFSRAPALPEPLPESSSPEVVEYILSTVDPAEQLSVFEYDQTAPLAVRSGSKIVAANGTLIELTYASPKGGRVPALLLLPRGKGPFPAIILQHGSLGHKEDLLDLGEMFAAYGAAAFLIDDPYSRPDGWQTTAYMGATWPYYTEQDMDVKIQTINDLQRAVDYLSEHPQIDPDRIAYMGLSYGAAMGGLLAGVETRIKAYVLNVGDGGLVEHTSDPGPDGLNVHFSEKWAEMMWPTEAIHFVSRAAPAALLFQNGLRDESVSPADAARFQQAGSEPKTIRWYDSGHNLPPEGYLFAAAWLQPYLGRETTWFEPNYRPTVALMDKLFSAWIAAALLSCAVVLIHWFVRREGMPVGVRITWMLLVIFTGPFGFAIYFLFHRYRRKIGEPDSAVQALAIAIMLTVPAVAGLMLADTWSGILPQINALLLLSIQYLTMVFIAVLFYRSMKPVLTRNTTGTLITFNLILAFTIVVGNSLAVPLGLGQEPELVIWWPLALTTLTAILVNFPIHLWLVRRGSEAWRNIAGRQTQTGVSDSLEAVRVPLGLMIPTAAASFLAILIAIIIVILQQTGMTLASLLQALAG